jgi:hypothetical protein
MSAFNPLPDQLQQDSGSPSVDVMAPPDQQAAAPAPQPAYPPSPDQGGPVPQGTQPDPDAGSNVNGWRAVLRGALSGLENHLKGAGEGLITGGIPGAVVGAVSPGMADRAMQYRQQTMQAELQQRQAAARSATQETQFAADNHDVQLAQSQIHLQQLQAAWDTMPHDFQESLLHEGAEAGQHLIDTGISPVFSGSEADAKAQMLARMQVNSDAPLNVTMLPDGAGNFNVFELPSADKPYSHAVTLTIGHDPQGQPITKTFPAGTISIGRGLNLETAAMVEQSKTASKIQTANATGITAKNEGAANKSNAQASAAPKVENLLVGSMPDGSQVAGTQQELQEAGASGITKLPTTEGSKVVVARQLVAPNGLFASVNQDIRELDAKGKLGVAASRWNDFLAGKVGDEPDFAKLRTDMGLLGTALMQAHVGARGSHEMLEHFKSLADYRISDAATLRSALGREYNYVTEKAMLPRKVGK